MDRAVLSAAVWMRVDAQAGDEVVSEARPRRDRPNELAIFANALREVLGFDKPLPGVHVGRPERTIEEDEINRFRIGEWDWTGYGGRVPPRF